MFISSPQAQHTLEKVFYEESTCCKQRYRDLQDFDIEDVVSEAMLHVIKVQRKFSGRGSFEGFVRISLRRAISTEISKFFSRRNKIKCSDTFDNLVCDTTTEFDDRSPDILAAIDQLPKELGDVVRIKYLSQNKISDLDVADLLDVSIRTVVLRKSKARQMLLKMLKQV